MILQPVRVGGLATTRTSVHREHVTVKGFSVLCASGFDQNRVRAMTDETKVNAVDTTLAQPAGRLGPIGTNLLGGYFLILPAAALWLLWRMFPEGETVPARHLLALFFL